MAVQQQSSKAVRVAAAVVALALSTVPVPLFHSLQVTIRYVTEWPLRGTPERSPWARAQGETMQHHTTKTTQHCTVVDDDQLQLQYEACAAAQYCISIYIL